MSISDAILDFLEHNRRGRYCDACIALKAGVKPPRGVNQICNQLSRRGAIMRAEGSCTTCRGSKITNVLAPAGTPPARHVRKQASPRPVKATARPVMTSPRPVKASARPVTARARPVTASAHPAHATAPQGLGIEEMRTGIVRICQELCKQAKIETAPTDGPAGIIGVLKEENLIPRHQANMMHTICNLRNVYVWEQLTLGPNERAVASAAWQIVCDWWESVRGT